MNRMILLVMILVFVLVGIGLELMQPEAPQKAAVEQDHKHPQETPQEVVFLGGLVIGQALMPFSMLFLMRSDWFVGELKRIKERI